MTLSELKSSWATLGLKSEKEFFAYINMLARVVICKNKKRYSGVYSEEKHDEIARKVLDILEKKINDKKNE